jgi:hypothetical protein
VRSSFGVSLVGQKVERENRYLQLDSGRRKEDG